jgi:hypothetical protein
MADTGYMEINDRVICVDTGGVPTLTLYKIYDARIYDPYTDIQYSNTPPNIGVIDDAGEFRNFKRKRFMLLSEWRLNKLESIGI